MMKLLMWDINMEKNIIYITDTCNNYVYELRHIVGYSYIVDRLIDLVENRKIHQYSISSVNRGDIFMVKDPTPGTKTILTRYYSAEYVVFSDLDEAMMYGMVNDQA